VYLINENDVEEEVSFYEKQRTLELGQQPCYINIFISRAVTHNTLGVHK